MRLKQCIELREATISLTQVEESADIYDLVEKFSVRERIYNSLNETHASIILCEKVNAVNNDLRETVENTSKVLREIELLDNKVIASMEKRKTELAEMISDNAAKKNLIDSFKGLSALTGASLVDKST